MSDEINEIEILAAKGRWSEIIRQLELDPLLATRVFRGDSTLLVRLTGYGNDEIVEKLLDLGADPNFVDKAGSSPLLAACEAAFEEADTMVTTARLLDAGADPNKPAYLGMNALHWATTWGLSDHIRLFLARGADPTLMSKDPLGPENAFQIANRKRRKEVIKILDDWRRGREGA